MKEVEKKRTNPSSIPATGKAESCVGCTSQLSFSSDPKLLPCLHIMCKSCFEKKSTQDNIDKGLSASLHCMTHKQERLKFFCVTCNQITCRDCQLIDHRNHSFLLIEEAMVTQKERLIKLLDTIKEQKNSVRARLQDLEGRINSIKEVKISSKKQLQNELQSLYTSLVLRCHQLSKELEDLCNEEEKSLKVIKSSLKMLEDRHEYITAFLHKMLNTKGRCILRHKAQIEKWVQRVLSQRKSLPDTIIHLSLSVNEHISSNIKNFASFKVTRVLPSAKEKYHNGNKLKNTPKDADKCHPGLHSESGATLSVPGTTVSQATVPSMSQAAADFTPLRKSMSTISKPVQLAQGLTDASCHPSSSSASGNLFQTTQSNTAECVGTQILPQSVSPQASQLKQVFKNLSHPLLTSLLQSNGSLPSPTVLNVIPTNLPQNIIMPNVVAPLSQSGVVFATPGITSCPSVAHPSILVHTSAHQSNTNNQFVPSLITLTPSAQSILNSSLNHTQQSIFQSQAVSGNSFSSQIASTLNQILPHHLAVSSTQSVNLQPSQSVGLQSNQLQFAEPKVPSDISSLKILKFHNYLPVMNVNKSNTLTCAPQSAPELTIVPASSNKDLDPPMSSTPQLPAASVSSVCSNTNLMECGSQTMQIDVNTCELPVKAPADSVCEGDTSVCNGASSVADESDNNLPTSTVPEEDTKARAVSAMRQPQQLLSTSLLPDCPSNQSISTSSKSPHESILTLSSTRTPSIKQLPSSSKELLSGEKTVIAKDPEQDDDDKTDHSELVKGMDEFEGTSEEPILRQDSNKTPLVSLLRLPILGSTQFRIVPSSQKDVILLQEISENQSIQRCIRITSPATAASLQADVHDCAVCLSAGALLQCAECGRSFHTTCHVPPILCDPIEMRVCSLCQDLLDDTDPFRNIRPKEPYLSLPDQRRCEQLLLTLMCENNSHLLYKTSKQTAHCVEFNLIVARLSGKCSPPYRSAAEMVSDLWALFEKLSSNSKKKDLIAKLQSAFQQRLNVSFGKNLHASLLKPLSSRDQKGAPETDVQRNRAKNTLKRMRDFLAANSSTLAKKAHTEDK
ncbi:E3 ubiquitin-protein ligase TRIM33 [Bagarius yarrelli]|uniref:E3 ubiquitin-protein ligase TRIM33 n=1 Tax=Bagarius yarrelli TaxID=175774 RepID=A0A556TPY3_BAGYA|nr:E3 ubiquitin-protein ligase TRIM33 [Bagarius yarrelli]